MLHRSLTGSEVWKPFEMTSTLDRGGEILFQGGSLVFGVAEIPELLRAGKAVLVGGKAAYEAWALGRATRSAAKAEELAAISDGTGRRLQVSTGGLRNEFPLTAAQEAEAIAYAQRLGMRGGRKLFCSWSRPKQAFGRQGLRPNLGVLNVIP